MPRRQPPLRPLPLASPATLLLRRESHHFYFSGARASVMATSAMASSTAAAQGDLARPFRGGLRGPDRPRGGEACDTDGARSPRRHPPPGRGWPHVPSGSNGDRIQGTATCPPLGDGGTAPLSAEMPQSSLTGVDSEVGIVRLGRRTSAGIFFWPRSRGMKGSPPLCCAGDELPVC